MDSRVGTAVTGADAKEERTADFFVAKDGLHFAGTHLLLELWDGEHFDDLKAVEEALGEAASAARAAVLNIHVHRFASGGGVSGVALLAESHISIHTWPERGFAAIDIFMCGACDPYEAVPALRRAFRPARLHLFEHKRGLLP
ncbi:MAG: adenosylmethionine decarboxylase [Rhodospirillales bacterium]|jgi:S-adenosylmethionine decarboxylase|nr:adenosylmethionine decarboxylase [Rhodospirillales bacterium]HIJ43438.1 adenosylmethionine decarboxylase [Rhodospirillaceae bacterium]MDP7097634.1 adenosylmethionine decarboxylase [Rhodospirillales bacterium]MDP7215712.1 adenosylmethionine decarboxylase [Rhodospirillales bacterium]HIJ46087.1 adenosylmethionine decarboxylase [Rhodospirillaceae bacterium]